MKQRKKIKQYKKHLKHILSIYTKNNPVYIRYFINDVFNICIFDDI